MGDILGDKAGDTAVSMWETRRKTKWEETKWQAQCQTVRTKLGDKPETRQKIQSETKWKQDGRQSKRHSGKQAGRQSGRGTLEDKVRETLENKVGDTGGTQ